MKTDKRLWEICRKIYKELFKKARPSRNFDDIEKSDEGKKHNWFMKYYLPQETQTKIIERHMKKYKLTANEQKKVRFEMYLGCAPRGTYRRNTKNAKLVR